MPRKVILLSIALVAPGHSAAPVFSEPILLQAGGDIISAGKSGYAGPAWHDVDGDGIKDLVVGRMTDDTVDYYRNTTKKGLPVFKKARAFLISGERLVVPGSC